MPKQDNVPKNKLAHLGLSFAQLLPLIQAPLDHDATPEQLTEQRLFAVCSVLFADDAEDSFSKAELIAIMDNVHRDTDPDGVATYTREPIRRWYCDLARSEYKHGISDLQESIIAKIKGIKSLDDLKAIEGDLVKLGE